MSTVSHFPATLALTLSLTVPFVAEAEGDTAQVALTIVDVLPSTGFATHAVTDVLGIRIGMTIAEFETALTTAALPMLADAKPIPDAPQHGPLRMGYVAKSGDVTPGFQWKDGYKMTFEPVRASAGLTMYSEMADALGAKENFLNGQYVWAAFGSPSVGARVQEIQRSVMLGESVDTQTMMDSITSKYGTPSRVKEVGNFWIEVSYYYEDGEFISHDHRANFLLSRSCKPNFFSGNAPEVLYTDASINGWYGPQKDPRTSKEFCDAGIFLRLSLGDTPNTIDQMDIAVVDNVARWENLSAILTQAEAAHAAWLPSAAGAKTTPDL